ncbi:uncharacterized protein LDX57_002575 [Aspergillus melleus]|uniref:uncharacterized protein n=1 Tax=Aspergillus melleus TaxID=138277 RepID=UPI001E8E55FD|nr:uncharacterized protein LDX57_002575 [Aspergillus melleus]KAH8424832.1 hypothetical protein LDX57_002575 [Aspergillus melleus]
MDLLRDSTLGQLVRFVTNNQCLLYPEEQAGFVYPGNYEGASLAFVPTPGLLYKSLIEVPIPGFGTTTPQSIQRDEESSSKQAEAVILVAWYSELDAENPQNWSSWKKTMVTAVLSLYTFTVYCASAIYTPSVEGVMNEYGVNHTVSTLGLSLYVLGYGTGPLAFSPISEIPSIGRNTPYILSLFFYALMAIPTVLTRSLPGFLFLRFLTGFLGSPCLATGGATLQDMYSSMKLPYGYTAWVGATFCAPALGPVISAFAVTASGNWRLSLWEVFGMATFTFVVMFLTFPETSAATILLRRARRLRKRLGDRRYISQSEISEAKLSSRQTVANALIRPLQITVLDPAVLFTNVYSSYSYGVYYSFFEAFPLVYTDIYGFDLGLTGAAFLSIVGASLLGTLLYLIYIHWCLVGLITRLLSSYTHRYQPLKILTK